MNAPTSNSVLQDILKKNKGVFRYELRGWIPVKKLSWKELSSNPNAIELLGVKIKIEKAMSKTAYEKLDNRKKVDWNALSGNPEAIKLLKENVKDIDWDALSGNPNAIEMLKENEDEIDWGSLSANSNPKAIEMLMDKPKKINWRELSRNPNATKLLSAEPEKIDWSALSGNTGAIDLLSRNPKKIDWEVLSGNPNAIELLRANKDKIVYHFLSTNHNAIKLFTENPDKIDWWFLSRNPNPLVIALLKTHQADIDWKEFSKNPSIFIDTRDAAKPAKDAKDAAVIAKPDAAKPEANVCERILTPKQVGPICWFMAAFVGMFYSQRSRKKLLDASLSWNKKKPLFTILKHILDDKYLKTADGRESEDYRKFSDDTFGKVLSLLHKENSQLFPYKPSASSGGFNPEFYIGRLYKLLNVDYRMYDYNVADKVFAYSFLNEEFNNKVVYKIEKKKINTYFYRDTAFKYNEAAIKPPEILMVIVRDDNKNTDFYKDLFPNNIINEGTTKDTLKSMKEQIFYKSVEYNLDAVLLANWNINERNGHAIAGITCKKGRYVYNGWTRTSMDPVMIDKNIARNIPCELMKYDWNISANGDFCLNPKKCIPEALKHKLEKHDICFNFSKGKRILVYVRKDTNAETSGMDKSNSGVSKMPVKVSPKATVVPVPIKVSPKATVVPVPIKVSPKATVVPVSVRPKSPKKSPLKTPKICPEGKVLNPKTNRCISIKNIKSTFKNSPERPKSPLKPPKPPKQPKVCPEGKVLNPKTNRCIMLKNKKKSPHKSSPKQSPLKPPKQPKVCPEGKVLNPKTGRCILIKKQK
jgi:hypothetical protein